MNKLEQLQIVLNTIAEQDLNNMLPVSSYLIGLAFEKKGFLLRCGAKVETNSNWYTIQRGLNPHSAPLVATVIFEMFKSFDEQPEKTQNIIYDFFINKRLQ
jgi:hypothetical protein